MPQPEQHRHILQLLESPREDLNVEIKDWLDLGQKKVAADMIRELIALANHGGGWLIFGFAEDKPHFKWANECPFPASLYSQDAINDLCKKYADPVFHCEVYHLESSAGNAHVIVEVPGGHGVPVRAKRGGPDGSKLRSDVYYVRRPGPASGPVGSAHEWDQLLKRCLSNQREELLTGFRSIVNAVGGESEIVQALVGQEEPLTKWRAESRARLDELLTADVSTVSEDPYAGGTFSAAYRLLGARSRVTRRELLAALTHARGNETGWPVWIMLTRPDMLPYPHGEGIEYWHRRAAGSHADFWRVSTDGEAFLLRGYQEDFMDRVAPRSVLSVTIPALRAGECLLHASRLAALLGATKVEFSLEWTGLDGRRLTNLSSSDWFIGGDYISRQDNVATSIQADAREISDLLPELVRQLLDPLYEIFDFFQVPPNFYAIELARLRGQR